MRRRRSGGEPQRRPAVKSRSQADSAKCEKALNGRDFGAVLRIILLSAGWKRTQQIARVWLGA